MTPTVIVHDHEFLENGRTIDPISVALVAESGDFYYAVVGDDLTIARATQDPWLVANVLASLPLRLQFDQFTVTTAPDGSNYRRVVSWQWDTTHPDWDRVKPRSLIADEVRQFIRSYPEVQLWSDYGAYDHVALSQLWGRMVDLPRGFPMFTYDVQQEASRLGISRSLPKQPDGAHNALSDARFTLHLIQYLRDVADNPQQIDRTVTERTTV